MNIFERAARNRVRFNTSRGAASVEDLFIMPLSGSKDGFDLDTLARAVNRRIKEQEEGSFVETTEDPLRKTDELKLELLKHVIKSKLDDRAAADKRAATLRRKQKLAGALARKQDQALENMSEEDILKELEGLEA
tara:strand:- start:430 stop:834 length:405 start_codon:yes stop_codon:yes gene_type:complete